MSCGDGGSSSGKWQQNLKLWAQECYPKCTPFPLQTEQCHSIVLSPLTGLLQAGNICEAAAGGGGGGRSSYNPMSLRSI